MPNDGLADVKRIKKVLLTSGKVFYDLAKGREQRKRSDVAILRLEQYYPLSNAILEVLSAYPEGTPIAWVQEEPRNMGAWYFLNANLPELLSRHSRSAS